MKKSDDWRFNITSSPSNFNLCVIEYLCAKNRGLFKWTIFFLTNPLNRVNVLYFCLYTGWSTDYGFLILVWEKSKNFLNISLIQGTTFFANFGSIFQKMSSTLGPFFQTMSIEPIEFWIDWMKPNVIE